MTNLLLTMLDKADARRSVPRRQHRHDRRTAATRKRPKLSRSRSSRPLLLRVPTLRPTGRIETPRLVQAVKAGDRATALALLRDAEPQVAAAKPDGTTPLHWAVRQNDLALVDRLLKTGADVNAANRYGVTPLKLACDQRRRVAARSVARRPAATPTPRAPTGKPLLHHGGARAGHVEAAKLLIERGASIDARESWHGQTPMMWAAAQGHRRHAPRCWPKRGADVNARSNVVEWERQLTSGAARQVAAARRPHAAAALGARELPRLPAGAARSRRRHQRDDPGPA